MKLLLSKAMVVARRDFWAIVGTPTFLVFLLAPLFMLSFGVIGGTGAASVSQQSRADTRIVALLPEGEAKQLEAADRAVRGLFAGEATPPRLDRVAPAGAAAAQALALLRNGQPGGKGDILAVLAGPLAAPTIWHAAGGEREARYLGQLAHEAELLRAAGRDQPAASARIVSVSSAAPVNTMRRATGLMTSFALFFLTLLLAGQAVGMLAEEKTNKVIEILAASAPLESVFLGKLLGMLGVSLVFIGFWGVLGAAAIRLTGLGALLAAFQPAVGLGPFLMLAAAYFTMAFLLLGAVFLGVGAQAATMREIQMLSLPITIFQVAMFGVAAAGAGNPGSAIETFAAIFPFSSPFAMAARAAHAPDLWPHLLALGWQLLWVAITVACAAALFRAGVLKSGGGFAALRRRFAPAA